MEAALRAEDLDQLGAEELASLAEERSEAGKPLPLELLRDYYKELSAATVEERMHRYQLRADRADVIVPALQIYISIMRWCGAEEIVVPRIGLADGLIKMLYKEITEARGIKL
jgi:exopolyphosphatase/guanosine-5'-triphosphate,3'-diphosphate pyrophosphatase